MLILSRKQYECIVVPEVNLKCVVTKICHDKVKLGFEAPEGLRILRSELKYDQRERSTCVVCGK